jgi:U6 snRNA-associated Sm-like protein LSm7
MSERGAFRGGRGGGRGGDRGGRGGGRGGAQAGGAAGQTERPKKENILDLQKYMDKEITVKFSGGREGKGMVWWGGMVFG